MVSVKTGFLNVKTVKLICQVTPPNSWIDNSYLHHDGQTNKVLLILSYSDCLDEVEEDNNEEEINDEEIGGEEPEDDDDNDGEDEAEDEEEAEEEEDGDVEKEDDSQNKANENLSTYESS